MDSIGRIKIQGFKSIKSLEFEIRPINVLIGANGSGKSNLVDVFEMLYEMRRSNFLTYVINQGKAEHLLHFGSRQTRKIVLELGLDSGKFKYDLELTPTNDDNLALGPQRIGTFGINGYPDGFGSVTPPREDQPQPYGVPFREEVFWGFDLDPLISSLFGSHRVYREIDVGANSPLKKMANLHDNRELRPDGSNLAPFLYFLRERHCASYSAIRRTIHMAAPFFYDFDLRPLQLNPAYIQLEWKYTDSDKYFHAASLSHGTLRFIFLATLFLQPQAFRPRVIIFDEPELGLHPYAISLLGALIRQASVDSKIIIATQSSLLVSQFEAEDIVALEREVGATQLRRLSQDDLAIWLEDYSLGQLWEKNVFGAGPQPE